jgi:flavorubredoxin
MSAQEIRPGIYWVGGIDWNVRNFHGYLTQQGTTYNAYLIVDEKIVLIDTVKSSLIGQMMERIGQIVDPSRIDYVLSNHVEPDHSGGIGAVLERAPNAVVVTSVKGQKGLVAHYRADWHFQTVATGDRLELGARNLTFFNTPMVHWPDSMVSYLPEEKILFSNDAFGQHLATAERYDDEIGWAALRRDAAKYYANIVMPFGKQVGKVLEALASLEMSMICPSHGVIWRSSIVDIIASYQRWARHETEPRALIVYDSMWHSTEAMAQALEFGLSAGGLPVTVRNLKFNHISDIMADVLAARLILLGSPTLNNGLLPTMGQFLTYLQGLKPQNRLGYAFGSYGWGGQSVAQLESAMDELGWRRPLAGCRSEYVPDRAELDTLRQVGRQLAETVRMEQELVL